MQIKKVRLWTADPRRTAMFYRALEFEVAAAGKKFVICSGNTVLEFLPGSRDENYHIAFTVAADHFEQTMEIVQRVTSLKWLANYNGYIANFSRWNARSFYCNDAAGNVIEFITRGDLPTETARTTNGVISVSEVGIVLPAHDFATHVAKLMHQFTLTHYDRQPPGESFVVLGDVHGLFIVVPEGRLWYGDEHNLAQPGPLYIEFEHAGKVRVFDRVPKN